MSLDEVLLDGPFTLIRDVIANHASLCRPATWRNNIKQQLSHCRYVFL